MREQFEAWHLDNYCGGVDRLKRCTNMDEIYYFEDVQLKWKAWQASRSACSKDLLPYYLKLSPEMRVKGEHAVSRAKEDQCYSVPVLESVFFEAAAQAWLDEQEELFEQHGLPR